MSRKSDVLSWRLFPIKFAELTLRGGGTGCFQHRRRLSSSCALPEIFRARVVSFAQAVSERALSLPRSRVAGVTARSLLSRVAALALPWVAVAPITSNRKGTRMTRYSVVQETAWNR